MTNLMMHYSQAVVLEGDCVMARFRRREVRGPRQSRRNPHVLLP